MKRVIRRIRSGRLIRLMGLGEWLLRLALWLALHCGPRAQTVTWAALRSIGWGILLSVDAESSADEPHPDKEGLLWKTRDAAHNVLILVYDDSNAIGYQHLLE